VTYNILSIAGSDPSGGAGIQADLKTFSALGTYGMAALTALTAQSTTGVSGVHVVPAEFVTQQLDTLFADVRVDAVKIGMLADSEIIAAVAAGLDTHAPPNVVLDPVMVAKSGDRLLAQEAIDALRSELLPRVDLITPNLPEAAELLGVEEAADMTGMADHARRLLDLGVRRVLVKGGHLAGQSSTDLLADAQHDTEALSAQRVATKNTHGTGCTLSSAIAALLPQHRDPYDAVQAAKDYLTDTLRHADELQVGRGKGPAHHFHKVWTLLQEYGRG
jgi:hydroxymethylpyrimidine/phosphomethylpyrimidine kinase